MEKRPKRVSQFRNFGKTEKKLISNNSQTHLLIFWHLEKTTSMRISSPQSEVEGRGEKKSNRFLIQMYKREIKYKSC
jgi:hypothetical protein